MARRRFTSEQIIGYLRQVEIKVSQGRSVEDVLRELGIVGSVYYCWRKEYGGLGLDQARRLTKAV